MSLQETLAFWKLAENPALRLPCWIVFVIILVCWAPSSSVVRRWDVVFVWEGLNPIFRRCLSNVGNCLQADTNCLKSDFLTFLTFQSDARGVWHIRVSPSFVIWWLWGENWLQKFSFCIEVRAGRQNLYQETAIGQKWRYLPEKGCDRLNNHCLSFLNENRSNSFWSEKCCNTGKKCTTSHTIVQGSVQCPLLFSPSEKNWISFRSTAVVCCLYSMKKKRQFRAVSV